MKKSRILAVLLVAVLLMSSVCAFAAPEYKFAFVLPSAHPFYNPFPAALEQAAADFGIEVPVIQGPADTNQEDQNRIIDSLIAQGVTGIAMMPSDSVAGNEKITEVVEMGIPVVGFAGAPEQPTDMTFCLATDVKMSAYAGTKALIEALGGEGNIVHMAGMLSEYNTILRMEGVEEACAEYEGVTLIKTLTDVDQAEPAQNAINNLMASMEDEIDGIVCTGYHSSVAVANAFRTLNETRIKAVGCDTDEAVTSAIRDGFMYGTMSQNAYGQAYLCAYALKLISDGYIWKADNEFLVNSGFYLMTKDNVDDESALALAATLELKETFPDYFDAPV